MKDNLIQQKSYDFALKIIALYRNLVKGNEYVLSKQLLRSGTSIGANVEEAQAGQSRADFISKMSLLQKGIELVDDPRLEPVSTVFSRNQLTEGI